MKTIAEWIRRYVAQHRQPPRPTAEERLIEAIDAIMAELRTAR